MASFYVYDSINDNVVVDRSGARINETSLLSHSRNGSYVVRSVARLVVKIEDCLAENAGSRM